MSLGTMGASGANNGPSPEEKHPDPKAPLSTCFLKTIALGSCERSEINSISDVRCESPRWIYDDFRFRINSTFAL